MYFLENIGFLTEKKYRSHKYLDMRVIDTKKAAANGYLQQPLKLLTGVGHVTKPKKPLK